MSVFWASIMIVILAALLSNKFMGKRFRISVLSSLSWIIALRLMVPFGFPTTQTYTSSIEVPKIYSFGRGISFSLFSVKKILIVIWLIGSVLMATRLFYDNYRVKRIFKATLIEARPDFLAAKIQKWIPDNVKVYVTPLKISPCMNGIFQSSIILPTKKYSYTEQKFIVQHELLHINNLDNLKKFIVELLVCFYWWFPLIYLFRRQVNLILDLRVDYQIVNNKSRQYYLDYVKCLIGIAEFIKDRTMNKNNLFSSNFVIVPDSNLNHRIKFLQQDYKIKVTSLWIKLFVIALPLIVTSIIIEPTFVDFQQINCRAIFSDRSELYILKNKGQYYLIKDGQKIGKIKDISKNSSQVKNLSIIKSEKSVENFKKK